MQETQVRSCVRKILRKRQWQPTPVFLPGKFHGQRSLAGYSPWSHKESNTAEHAHARAHTHTHAHTPPPGASKDLSQDQSSWCLPFPLVFKEKNMDCVKQSGKKFILSGLNGLCSLKIIQAQKGKAYFDRMGKQIEEKAGKHSIEWREKKKWEKRKNKIREE